MSKRILKWVVPVDDRQHEIGGGAIVEIGHQGHVSEVVVWTEEDATDKVRTVAAQVYATGTTYPDSGVALGSVIHLPSEGRVQQNLVWHLVVFPGA